jgi:maleylacetate reductase
MQSVIHYVGQPYRAVFGGGSVQHLERDAAQLSASRTLVLCTPDEHDLGKMATELLGARAVDVARDNAR